MRASLSLIAALTLAGTLLAQRHAREGGMVLEDRGVMLESSVWIYNDVDKAVLEARKTGRPILLVFR